MLNLEIKYFVELHGVHEKFLPRGSRKTWILFSLIY
jgi:hypothetical protein